MKERASDNICADRCTGLAWRDFLRNTTDFIFVKDLNLIYLDASQAFVELVGRSSPDELVGKTDYELFSDRALADRYVQDDRRVIETGEPILDMIEPIPPLEPGVPRFSSTSKYPYADETGHIAGIYGVGRDLDETKHRHYELIKAAETDSMTTLLNHDATVRLISGALAKCGDMSALFMIDIDNFKNINDQFGHQTGDEVITEVAAAIKNTFRDSDIVGRIGGDEFMVLMRNTSSLSVIRKKASDLINALQYDLSREEGVIELTGSIGISICRDGDKSFEQLYSEADSALYKAKAQGKNRYIISESGEKLEANGLSSSTESALANSVHLRTLLNSIEGAVLVCDVYPNGDVKVTYASPSTIKTFNRSWSDIGKHGCEAFSVVLPEDLPELLCAIRETAGGGPQLDHAYRVTSSKGETEWRHICGSRMPESEGEVQRVICTVTDLTSVKEAESVLKKQKRELAERYERAAEMKNRVDTDSVCSFELNLTQNLCVKQHVPGAYCTKGGESSSADGVFTYMRSLLPGDGRGLPVSEAFSRTWLLDAFKREETSFSFEHKFMAEQDFSLWVQTDVVMAQNPDSGDVEAYICVNDIDAGKTIQLLVSRFIDIDYEFAALIDVKTGVITFVKEGRDTPLMPPCDRTRYPEVFREIVPKLIIQSEADMAYEAMKLEKVVSELNKNDFYSCSFSIRTKDGGTERKKWSFIYLDENRDVIAYTRRDVTDIYETETDSLTGIYNKAGFCRAARDMITENPKVQFCITMTDLDHFKIYNDIYGIRAGDELLAAVGRLLRENRAKPLTVYGHLQGDHFVSLVPAKDIDINQWRTVVMNVLQGERPEYSFTLRFGMYIIDDPSTDIAIMCDRALMALHSTKGDFYNFFATYGESMKEDIFKEQRYLSLVRSAFESGEFCVYLQPQYDQTTGKMLGAEALARWVHNGTAITPSNFISVLEKNGFIMQFDEYIWECVCKLLRRWLDEGRAVVPISVNLSRLDIYNPGLHGILAGLVKKYALTTDMLRLEITETAYTQNPAQLATVITELRRGGFFIEMDDFGTGYSSLSMLKDIEVDMVKLDLGFLKATTENAGRRGLILSTIVRMAHWLNTQVIAEGVELPHQADFLRTIGCTLVQGYLYARPMPVKQFESLLTEESVCSLDKITRLTSLFNNQELWDSESLATVMFNGIIGAACFFEYKDGRSEILRANDTFYEATGSAREELSDMRNDLMGMLLPAERQRFRKAIETALEKYGDANCTLRWDWKDDANIIIFSANIKAIARSDDRYIFYMTLDKIN